MTRHPTRARSLAGALLALALLASCAHRGGDRPATWRETSFGPVTGADASATHGTYSWKGVPFAEAPVGALRWRAPRDPQPWREARAATQFGPACRQTGRLYGPGLHNRYDATVGSTLGQPLGAEDCLTLNIWQPSAPSPTPRPVIVFVHGGSNITGYTADPVYDGSALARRADAVVVTVNYRLGLFGFLHLPELHTGDRAGDSGNFALLDIVKALEFVQANIARFGGDPARVTLMGQSAGAVNVYALLTSPMLVARSTPLFHRLVALSGGISTARTLPAGAIATVPAPPVSAARGRALLLQSLVADGSAADDAAAERLAAARTPEQTAASLRRKPSEDLLAVVQTRLAPRGMAATNPVADGWVVATDPIAAVRAGRYVRVPVLAGNTRDETKLFPAFLALRPEFGGVSGRLLDDAQVFRLAAGYDPEAPPATTLDQWIPAALRPVDTPVTGFDARSAELNRLWFLAIRDDVLNALRAQQAEVWHYRFDWDRLPAPFDAIFGAAHTFDLPFVFGNFGPSLYANVSFTRANERGRLALSQRMMDSLAAFARDGDPNHPGLGTAWRPWPAGLRFDADDSTARAAAVAVP
ncbi:carboxylesterase/lipase family protein [Aquabacterium sp. J223]|uniref:carboxylesterase/lipase family protein n=1 Tax=Aquabacterium sp. J223 TaxID=2898431 RepID=UPI0021ADC27C|nr:carboxylesterase family protein [Aquabacterium sp. J223]UUX96702.1 carboxylesterase family protein [Aquabacterium sp. J223]